MSELFEKNFIVNVFKHQGITSQGVVTATKRALGVKTAGHCGTLDPLAVGVLPVMVGRAVKASSYLTDHDKKYVARMKLGIETDTGDITGKIINKYEGIPKNFEDVVSVIPSFVGEIIQVPPMYSALKVDGKKLYELARNGVEVERKGRKICIYSLSASCLDNGEIELSVICSRGTYIRTLIEDIGKAVGCGAVMSALTRSAVGNIMKKEDFDVSKSKNVGNRFLDNAEKLLCEGETFYFVPMFSLNNAVGVEDLKNGNVPPNALIAVEDVFYQYPKISFPSFYERLFSNGCEIYISKLEKNHPAQGAACGDVFRVYGENGFFALCEAKEYENGLALKQIKRF